MVHRSRQISVMALALLLTGCASPPPSLPPVAASASPDASTVASTPAPTTASGGSDELAGITLEPIDSAPQDRVNAVRLSAGPSGFWAIADPERAGSGSVLVTGSADGSTWRRMDVGRFPGRLVDVAGSSLGAVLATESDSSGDGQSVSTLWYAPDATHFQRVPDQAGLSSAYPERLFAGRAGFAMIGTPLEAYGTFHPSVWTSADGRTWSAATSLDGKGIDAIVVTDTSFVAIATGSQGTDVAALASRDGQHWQASTGGPDSMLDAPGLAAGPPVLVGDSIVTVRSDRTMWRGTFLQDAPTLLDWNHDASTDPTFAGADVVAAAGSAAGATMLGFDRTSLHALSWTTRDGFAWARVDLGTDVFDGGVPSLLARSASTAVSVGQLANTDGDVVSRPWRTEDGVTWNRVGVDEFGPLPSLRTGPCPTAEPTTPAALVSLERPLWPTCFGNRQLTISGFVLECDCGGTTTSDAQPAWLIGDEALPSLRIASDATLDPAAIVGAWIDPARRITLPPAGTKITVQGHFDDPVSPSCRVVPRAGTYVGLRPTAWLTAECRQRFVVTAVRARS